MSEQADYPTLPIDQIKVGERHRKDLGDIAGLAKTIGDRGLLHPLVLNTRHELIAGERRLAALRLLGWTKAPVHIVGSLDAAREALLAERDENAERKAFTPLEAVALGKSLEELEKPKANKRQKEGPKPSGNLPEGNGDTHKGQTRDKVAAAVGLGGSTYERAKFVADKAEENPKLYAEFAQEMERTGKVDPAYRKAKRQAAFGHVPISETRVERTGGDDLEDALMSLNRKLLGIEHQYGTWKQIRDTLGEEERKGLREITIIGAVRHLQKIIKELS